MLKYLENLRNKPEAERRKSVFNISIGITTIIVIIWVISLFFRIGSTNFSFDTADIDSKMPSLKETFKNFLNQASTVFDTEKTYTATSTETQ